MDQIIRDERILIELKILSGLYVKLKRVAKYTLKQLLKLGERMLVLPNWRNELVFKFVD